MKLFSIIITSIVWICLLMSNLKADEKYIMQSGDIYHGEKIEENDTFIKIKQINSDISIEIRKSSIDEILPVMYRIITDKNYEIFGNVIERTQNWYKVKTSDGVVVDVERSGITSIEYVDEDKYDPWTNPVPSITKLNYTNTQNYSSEGNIENSPINKINDNKNTRAEDTYSQYYKKVEGIKTPFVGVSLGAPILFNLTLGYHYDDVIVDLQGGASDEYAGGRISLLLNLYETNNRKFFINIGLCIGYLSHKRVGYYVNKLGNTAYIDKIYYYDKYFFTGGLVQAQWYGFNLELGLGTSVMSDNIYVEDSIFLFNIGYKYYFN